MADTRITAISTTYDRDTISLSTDYLIGDRSGGSSFRAQVDEIVLGVLENIAENVGIGTASPGALLEVESAASTTGVIINNTATDGDPYLSFALSGTSAFTMGVDDGDSDKFKIGTTAVGANTRLTIDSSGNVGIGTTSPANALEVGGTLGSFTGTRLNVVNSSIVSGFGWGQDADNRAWMLWDASGDYAYFGTRAAGTSYSDTLVLHDGKIGVDITSPTAKLQVNGSFAIVDGMTAPSTISGYAVIYVDSADGDLKVKFGNGFVATIASDS